MSRVHSAEPVIAGVRFYTAPPGGAAPAQPRLRTIEGWPPFVLLLDTETTPDASQRLRLGSYRFCEWQRDKGGQWRLVCLEEGLFCGEDLPTRAPNDFQTLKNCVLHATADTPGTPGARLPLYSRTELVNKVLYKAGLVGRALIVGFNLPFDLSRLAVAATEARGKGTSKRFVRGFSFVVWAKEDTTSGAWAANAVRPWLRIKHRDNKSADIEFTTAKAEELWSGTGANRRCYKGRFLDLKTFAFALLGTSHTLKSLAEAVGAPSKKGGGDHNGPITAEYVDYNRQDLRVSLDILEALRQEFDRHPIAAEP